VEIKCIISAPQDEDEEGRGSSINTKIDNGVVAQFNLIHYPCYLIDLHFVSSSIIIGCDLGFHLIHPRQ
jgi:hypothetical protein